MSKFKKMLSWVLVVALTAGVSITGTMAYLQDTDSDINVMTLGNVKIEQHEYQRATNSDGSYKTDTIDNQDSYVLEAFEQGKPLYPIVGDPSLSSTDSAYAGWDEIIVRMTQVDSYGSMQVFAGQNAQDKFVTVENTGKTDAYVRTLVAIECGTGDASLIGTGTRCVLAENAETSTAPWVSNEIGKITVDNNTYTLYEYVYRGANDVKRHVNGVLPAGDTTYPSLCQVYLKSSATNEDMEAIDGNDNGTLDILVVSQAVQAAGFEDAQTALDAAFGDITTDSHPWKNQAPIFVNNTDEAQDALDKAEAGTTIVLNAGDYGTLYLRPVAGQANTVTDCDYLVYKNEMLRKVENLTIVGAPGATVDAIVTEAGYVKDSGGYVVDIQNLVIDSVEFNDTYTNASHSFAAPVFFDLTYTNVNGLTVKNCKLIGDNDRMNFVYFYGSGKASNSTFETAAKNITITGNTVDGIARLCELRQAENVTITNNTIKNTDQHGILLAVDKGTYSGDVTISGNKADSIGERFVRMAGAGNANVVIKNNVITNYMGEDNDYIKVTDYNVEPVIENNTKS